MAKNSSQITFEFQDPPDGGDNAGVGVRIKSLKKPAEEKKPEPKDTSAPLFGDLQPDSLKPDPVQPDDLQTDHLQTDHLQTDHLQTDHLQSDDSRADAPVETITDVIEFSPHDETRDSVDVEITDANDAKESAEAIESTAEISDSAEDDVSAETSHAAVKTKSTRGRKSLKTIDEGTELINIPPDEQLFKKQYYSIGEVAEMFHVNQSLLRFWETEFDIIQPRKNRKGDRHFRPIDIKNLLLIHDLLRRRKLTIEGAKDFLRKNKRSPERFVLIQSLQKIKGFLLEVKATL